MVAVADTVGRQKKRRFMASLPIWLLKQVTFSSWVQGERSSPVSWLYWQ